MTKILYFSAPWCQPCVRFSPTVSKVAEEHSDKVVLEKVNVDEDPDKAAEFNIRSVPTLVFVKGDKEARRLMGAVPLNTLQATFDEVLT